MGTRSVTAAICVSLLRRWVLGIATCARRPCSSEARWLMERGNAQALEYAERLDNSVADAQLKTFAERRTVMEQAHLWQRGQMLGLMAGALAALAAYMLYLLRRLDSQLDDASWRRRELLRRCPLLGAPRRRSSADAAPLSARRIPPSRWQDGALLGRSHDRLRALRKALDIVGNQVGRRDACPTAARSCARAATAGTSTPPWPRSARSPSRRCPRTRTRPTSASCSRLAKAACTPRRARTSMLSAAEALFRKK